MQGSIEDKIKKSLFWNTFLPNIFQIYRFAVSIVIARILEPKDFGIMGIASIFIFYANSLTNFGFSTALIQKKEINEKHINSVFTINLFISVCLVLLTIYSAKFIANFFVMPELEDVLKVQSVIFIITSFYIMPVTLVRREVNFKIVSIIEFIRGIMQTLVVLIFAFFGFGYWSLVWGGIISILFGTVVINCKVRWIPKIKYDPISIREILTFGSWNFLSAQLRLLSNYLEKLIIGKFLGPVSLGFYEKAYSFAFMPIETISNRIGGVMFSSFARNQTNKHILKNQFLKSITLSSLICFPIFLGLVSVAKYFVLVLLGKKWEAVIVPLQILSIAFIFYSLIDILSAINIGAGNYKRQITGRIFSLVFMTLGCLYFAKLGIDVVAMVILVSNILFFWLSFSITQKLLSISWFSFVQAIFPALSGSLIMFITIKLVSVKFIKEIDLINFLILLIVGITSYLLWIFIIDFNEARFFKRDLKSKLVSVKQNIFLKKGLK